MNDTVKKALLSVSQSVYLHTAGGNRKPPYIVYGVDGDNNLFGGNRRAELADSGYIDLYTKDAEDSLIDAIPAALEAAGVAFYLNSVQYEDTANLVHYEWRWECA